jgi:hypothetical protein
LRVFAGCGGASASDVGAEDGGLGDEADSLDVGGRQVLPATARSSAGAALRLVVCVGVASRARWTAELPLPAARIGALPLFDFLRDVVSLRELVDVHGIWLGDGHGQMCEGEQTENGRGGAE